MVTDAVCLEKKRAVPQTLSAVMSLPEEKERIKIISVIKKKENIRTKDLISMSK